MLLRTLSILFFLALAPTLARAEVVVADEGIEMTREEFEVVLETSPEKIKRRAANDLGDRFELITQLLATRKLAATADDLTPDDPGYWELRFKLLQAREQFMFQRLVDERQEPDFEPLAKERYKTEKEKYARYPETRASSHILFRSPPGQDRTELREKAAQVLAELRDGADFEAYVEEYSEDPGSRQRGGSLNRWIRLGDPDITPPYSGALFEIDEVGGYSEVTDSQFGLHIIRLDGIRESGYLPYERVRARIIKDLRAEFRTLAAKEVRARFNLTDDAFIDGEAMEELFAPYKD
ncbi:MAG: peptidylprolyl isomerase [Pseudohaliea sp.]